MPPRSSNAHSLCAPVRRLKHTAPGRPNTTAGAPAHGGGETADEIDGRPRVRQNGGITEEREVATLNVKNLPDSLYRKLQARAKRDHRSVAQEVTHLLSEALEEPKALSILELQGLGKELWKEIDAADHVRGERAAWD